MFCKLVLSIYKPNYSQLSLQRKARTYRSRSAKSVRRTVASIADAEIANTGSPVGRLCRRCCRTAVTGAQTGGPLQVTQAVVGNIVPPAHGLINGSAGRAYATTALVRWFVGDTFSGRATAQRPAGVIRTTLPRVEGQQLQVQPTGILQQK